MNLPKVVHIITRLILGGAQENTLLTCRGLMQSGRYEVTLVTGPAIGPEGELIEQARAWGVPLEIIPEMRREINPLRDWRSVAAIRAFIAGRKPQIVHTHSSKAGIIGRYAARKEHVPVIVHSIHGLPFHRYEKPWNNWLYRELETRAAEHTDAIVCVADAMTAAAVDAGVAAASKFRTIYSGMDVEPFLRRDYDTGALKRHFGIRADEPVVGKVARLAPLKGYEFVIRAMQEILLHVPKAKFLFVGDGPAAVDIRRQVYGAGLQNHVIFAGLVPASLVPTYIALMDVVVHASLREGLARVIPQAMLMEKPVIAYNLDGTPEAIEDGVTGCIVPPESVHELALKAVDLLQHPAKAREMGRRGMEFARARFDARLMVEQIDALYQELMKKVQS